MALTSTLPALEPHAAGEEVVQILLVDDTPANLEALEVTLESTGCRFVLARSADEALLALLEGDFAAIVLDVRMPGMSGLELASLIRSRRRTKDVPILFLTAHMLDEVDVIKGYTVGAVDYLTKPIKPEILRSKIAVFVDLHRKTRALAREVQERQRAEEALRIANQDLEGRVEERTAALHDADKRKDQFLAALAHELRNPLAALRSATEIFRLKAPAGGGLDMPLGVVERQLKHMTRLIDDLLDVSRITRDKLTLRREHVELTRVIAAAVETSKPIIERHGHTLTVDVPTAPVYLDADVVRLSQVFSNLLDNAAKYTSRGGKIRLSAEAGAGHVLVRVADNGAGIDPDELPKIFDLFLQAHETPGGYGGLGIGLTLARRLVEMHGGSVTAHSDGTGKGSEFLVRLPAAQGKADKPRAQPADAANQGEHTALPHSFRVLIVEDNRDAADTLQEMLEEWGQRTRVAYDALAALEVAGQFKPELVLLDVGLPQMHGYDVARRMRDMPWGKDVVIAAVTGWGQEADRMQSKAAGIDHHLLKPVDPAVLRQLLSSL